MNHYYDEDDAYSGGTVRGKVQTKDEVMGIFDGRKRVNNLNRDDVANHITACETWGYLTPEQARARRDTAEKAQTEGELFHLVRDLPNEEKLAALGVRKRLSSLAHGGKIGKITRWLLTSRLGRAVFHSLIAVLTATFAIVPGMVVSIGHHGHFGTAGAVLTVVTAIIGGIAFIVNFLFAGHWFIEEA